jgi:hypothetical protein
VGVVERVGVAGLVDRVGLAETVTVCVTGSADCAPDEPQDVTRKPSNAAPATALNPFIATTHLETQVLAARRRAGPALIRRGWLVDGLRPAQHPPGACRQMAAPGLGSSKVGSGVDPVMAGDGLSVVGPLGFGLVWPLGGGVVPTVGCVVRWPTGAGPAEVGLTSGDALCGRASVLRTGPGAVLLRSSLTPGLAGEPGVDGDRAAR